MDPNFLDPHVHQNFYLSASLACCGRQTYCTINSDSDSRARALPCDYHICVHFSVSSSRCSMDTYTTAEQVFLKWTSREDHHVPRQYVDSALP